MPGWMMEDGNLVCKQVAFSSVPWYGYGLRSIWYYYVGIFYFHKTEISFKEINDYQFIKLKQIAKGDFFFFVISKENTPFPF